MLKRFAETIAHTLSNPKKMPGKAYGIPAKKCKTGSKLHKIPGSVCEFCYAREGMYNYPSTVQAMDKRLSAIDHPMWEDAMVKLVWNQIHFRWHDSGDIQTLKYLKKIVRVAKRTPHVEHFLPTKEHGIVARFLKDGGIFPANLTVRLSAHMRDEVLEHDLPTSMVYDRQEIPTGVFDCPAYSKEGKHTCESAGCRACWDPNVKVIGYPFHTKGKIRGKERA